MPIYDKSEIGRAAQQYGFVRDTFEKVLRLKEILQYLNEEEYLRTHLILKGGTAINLTIFDLPRLSVDIDLDYTPNDSKEDMLQAREKITALIVKYMESQGYRLSDGSRFMHSLDAFYFQYTNAGGSRDMIKLELNYSLRAHIFEPVYRRILSKAFDDGIMIRTVAPMEIFAAKGNALLNRAAARDLYDWGNMIQERLFETNRDLFRKCFAFYTSISAVTANKLFNTSAIDSLTYEKIRKELFPVIGRRDSFVLEESKRQAKEYIAGLMKLTESEEEYMDRFVCKEYRPELLFDDKEIVERIRCHPMALWRCDYRLF